MDGDRGLSDTWTGFTRFIVLNEKPPDGYTWSGGRLQENRRPPGLTNFGWKCGNTCPMHPNVKRSKNGLSKKPKLDNARRLRGMYFIGPKDEEFKDIMKMLVES